MYWFWYLLFAAEPALLLLGMAGYFGKEAKEVADHLAQVVGAIFFAFVVLAAIGALIYLILKGVGLIQ